MKIYFLYHIQFTIEKNEHSVGLLLLLSFNIQVEVQLLRVVLFIYLMSILSSC